MEASPLPTFEWEAWAQRYDQSLDQQRHRIRQFLAAQRERLKRAEATLAKQFRQLAEELSAEREELATARSELEHRSQQLDAESETLEQHRRNGAQAKSELDRQRELLDADRAQWQQLREQAGQQQSAWAEQIEQQRQRFDHQRRKFQQREAALDAAEARLAEQREQLAADQREQQAEADRLIALHEELEAKQTQLRQREAEFQADLQGQLEEAREQEDRLTAELELLRKQHRELAEGLDASRRENAELSGELAAAHRRGTELAGELDGELDGLRVECDRLRLRLAEASNAPSPEQQADAAEFQRRYEMAMDDLRALRAKKEQLERQLEAAKSAKPSASTESSGALDWEAQKQRLLAALEADFDPNDPGQRSERLKIDEVIRKTDRVVAEKDRRIAELHEQLEHQRGAQGSLAVGAAALGEMLDNDAIVQQEREKLAQLQQQWREKLRQAEIDLSVERAKLARERAALEEKTQTLAAEHDAEGDASHDQGDSQPSRGRWLARLGLKDDNRP